MTPIKDRARNYAIATTSTRCSMMGTAECQACKVPDRGYCDYRSRYDAYVAGAQSTIKSDFVERLITKIVDELEDIARNYEPDYYEDTDGWTDNTETGYTSVTVGPVTAELKYTIECQYNVYTEEWTDPDCSRQFCDVRDQTITVTKLLLQIDEDDPAIVVAAMRLIDEINKRL